MDYSRPFNALFCLLLVAGVVVGCALLFGALLVLRHFGIFV